MNNPVVSVESMIALIQSKGLQINNLFQCDVRGGWQANLRNKTHGFAFGHGHGPVEALTDALTRALTEPGETLISPPITAEAGPKPKKLELTLEDLA